MKEALHFQGADYNLLATFFTSGYLVGQIPSQLLLTKRMTEDLSSEDALTWTSSPLILSPSRRAALDNRDVLLCSSTFGKACLRAPLHYRLPRESIRRRCYHTDGELVHTTWYVCPTFPTTLLKPSRTRQKNCNLLLSLLRSEHVQRLPPSWDLQRPRRPPRPSRLALALHFLWNHLTPGANLGTVCHPG